MTTAAVSFYLVLTLSVVLRCCEGSGSIGCTTVFVESGPSYKWAVRNPALVGPYLIDYEVKKYRSPLMAILMEHAIRITAPADMTANFNLTDPTKKGAGSPEKYVLQSIEFRKPAVVPEGSGQTLSHVLEAVLIHREITGTGYFANVIVPYEVGADAGVNILAPLLDQSTLPNRVGQESPVARAGMLPLNIAGAFENASFQHFWTSVPTSCNSSTTGARILMRNASLVVSKEAVNAVLDALQWAPSEAPVMPPAATFTVPSCARGSTCSLPKPKDLAKELTAATKDQTAAMSKLKDAKKAMDASLLALGKKDDSVTNSVYDTAVKNRDDLRNAEAVLDTTDREVSELQEEIATSKSIKAFDSNAPPKASDVKSLSAAPAASASSSPASAAKPAVSAKPALLSTGSMVQGCESQGLASPSRVDLARDAEHVDANTAGTSEALLFWRLSATPLTPSAAAVAEAKAESPQLHVANLGDRLRVTAMPEGQHLLVLLVHGQEFPVSFADISTPAEHATDGKKTAAEIQLVHLPKLESSKPLALAVQLDESMSDDEGDQNPWLQQLLGALPRPGELAQVSGSDPMSLHKAFQRGVAGHYYRYTGRLSRDSPCAAIKWHVLEERGTVSRKQLAALQQVLRPPGSSQAFSDPSALQASVLASSQQQHSTAFEQPSLVQRAVGDVAPVPKVVRQPFASAKSGQRTAKQIVASEKPSLKSLLLSLPRMQRENAESAH